MVQVLVEIYIYWSVGYRSLERLQTRTHKQVTPSIFHSFVQLSTKPYPKHILNHNMPNHDPQFIPCLSTKTLFSLSKKAGNSQAFEIPPHVKTVTDVKRWHFVVFCECEHAKGRSALVWWRCAHCVRTICCWEGRGPINSVPIYVHKFEWFCDIASFFSPTNVFKITK